jgi:hypothetical protein
MIWKGYLKDGSVDKFQQRTQNWAFEMYGSSWTNSIQMWNLMNRDIKRDWSVKFRKEWQKSTFGPNAYKGR